MAMDGLLNFLQDPRGSIERSRCSQAAYTPCGLTSSNLAQNRTSLSREEPSNFLLHDLEQPGALAIRHSPRDIRTVSRRTDDAEQSERESNLNARARKSQLVIDLLEGGDEIDIDEDVYGAALYVICFDIFEVLTGVDHDGLGNYINLYRLCFILFLLLFNYVLQLSMLYWIYYFVALPTVHTVQMLYKDFHGRVYDIDGHFDQEAWSHYPRKDELCSIAFSNFFFTFLILILWWLRMLDEVRTNERTYRKIHQIHLTEDPAAMIVQHDDKNVVVHLTRGIRALLDLALIIPKVIITTFLTIVGTVWLAATNSFSDLLLNAIALEFVIVVDEVLFNAILPESMKEEIAHTKLIRPAPSTSDDPAQQASARLSQKLRGYKRSTLYLFGTIFAVYFYMTFGQYIPIIGVFPGYAHDINCPLWQASRTETLCFMGEDCFPTEGGVSFGNQFLPPSPSSSGRR